MKKIYVLFIVVALCFIVLGCMGHQMAWSAAALCFFAAAMVAINDRNQK